jgi:hypothetical protein
MKVYRFILLILFIGARPEFKIPMRSVPITNNVVSSNPAQARCTRCNFMLSSLSVTCDRKAAFSGYSGFFHQLIYVPGPHTTPVIDHEITAC